MAENNAVTKEELKEVMAEMRQDFRQGLAETNQNVVELRHKVDANEQKHETFRAERLARFDVADQKHDAVVNAIFAHEKKTDAQYEELRGMLSKLMTAMDPQTRELEIIRHEQLSLGVIQDRHGRDIDAIKKHLELEGNHGKPQENTPQKQSLKRNRKPK